MSDKALTLLADTNLFFECKKLEELPWSELNADPITILVTRPVLDEIDKHKKGSGRTRKRALAVFRRVRDMLKTGEQSVVICEAGPRVIFQRAHNLRFDPDLKTELSTSKNDDRLIGLLSSAIKGDLKRSFCLFTHDSGPAGTAEDLGLPFRLIEDHWLRDDPPTAAEKEVEDLKQDLSAYRNQEPNIEVQLDGYDTPNGPITLTCQSAPALTTEDIDRLIDDLKSRFPIQTDFSTLTKRASDSVLKIVGKSVSYVPPPEGEIKAYKETAYPEWVECCRGRLSELHKVFCETTNTEGIKYFMTNSGSRPAEQVRVNFRADGDIYFMRYSKEGSERRDEVQEEMISSKTSPSLPPPPQAPQPTRIVKHSPETASSGPLRLKGMDIGQLAGMRSLLDDSSGIGRMIKQQQDIKKNLNPYSAPSDIFNHEPQVHGALAAIRNLRPPTHDPEAFYYDEWPSDVAVDDGALTCDLWRHQSAAQAFSLELHADKNKLTGGSFHVEVHAQNLTRPVTLRTKVQVQQTTVDTLEEAKRIISEM
ncbi:MAG: hypothetical protein COA84_12845 [Robiginitomaculum sp.]|nr:MAG: hypothetical protein COA84_12845 [Robiginitomaculum sp.]